MSQPNSYISALRPYAPGLPAELVARQYDIAPENIVILASNENPRGPSPKARQAVIDAVKDAHRYPEQYALIQELAEFYSVAPDMLVLGNGSNDVLDLIARLYLDSGDAAVSSQYAFIVYQLVTQAMGADNSIVPARHYGHDLAAMLQAITPATKVVWIANPNNPTGTFIPYTDLRQFLERVPSTAIVVFDEAYYEYVRPEDRQDTTQWPRVFPNLIVVRTFSKIYGLAGLRIGYGIAAPPVVELLNRIRQPFNVSYVGLAAARAALADTNFATESYQANLESRRQLTMGIRRLGLEQLPAFGNFVTFIVPETAVVNEALLHQGIIVRPLVGYGMPNALRVTAGLPSENARFLAALEEACKC